MNLKGICKTLFPANNLYIHLHPFLSGEYLLRSTIHLSNLCCSLILPFLHLLLVFTFDNPVILFHCMAPLQFKSILSFATLLSLILYVYSTTIVNAIPPLSPFSFRYFHHFYSVTFVFIPYAFILVHLLCVAHFCTKKGCTAGSAPNYTASSSCHSVLFRNLLFKFLQRQRLGIIEALNTVAI